MLEKSTEFYWQSGQSFTREGGQRTAKISVEEGSSSRKVGKAPALKTIQLLKAYFSL